MELRAPTTIAAVLVAVLSAFIVWQFVDDGLVFVKSRLPSLTGSSPESMRLVAFRARFEQDKRTYWLLALTPGATSIHRVVLLYGHDGRPSELQLLAIP